MTINKSDSYITQNEDGPATDLSAVVELIDAFRVIGLLVSWPRDSLGVSL